MKYVLVADELGNPLYTDHAAPPNLCPPLVITQLFLRENLNEKCHSIQIGNLLVVFENVGDVFLTLVSNTGESELFLRRQLYYIGRLLLLVFGKAYLSSRAVMAMSRERKTIDCIVRTVLHLFATQQSLIVDAMEHLEVNDEIREKAASVLRGSLAKSPSVLHAFLYVGDKLLTSATKPKHTTLPPLEQQLVYLLGTCTLNPKGMQRLSTGRTSTQHRGTTRDSLMTAISEDLTLTDEGYLSAVEEFEEDASLSSSEDAFFSDAPTLESLVVSMLRACRKKSAGAKLSAGASDEQVATAAEMHQELLQLCGNSTTISARTHALLQYALFSCGCVTDIDGKTDVANTVKVLLAAPWSSAPARHTNITASLLIDLFETSVDQKKTLQPASVSFFPDELSAPHSRGNSIPDQRRGSPARHVDRDTSNVTTTVTKNRYRLSRERMPSFSLTENSSGQHIHEDMITPPVPRRAETRKGDRAEKASISASDMSGEESLHDEFFPASERPRSPDLPRLRNIYLESPYKSTVQFYCADVSAGVSLFLVIANQTRLTQDALDEEKGRVEEELLSYLSYFITKQQTHISMLSYVHLFPGLVHFLYVDRARNRVIAPNIISLCGHEFRENACRHYDQNMMTILKNNVWYLVQASNDMLAKGFTSMAARTKHFRLHYRLWVDSEEDITPVSAAPPSVFPADPDQPPLTQAFYDALPHVLAPSLKRARILEVFCIFLPVVPLDLADQMQATLAKCVAQAHVK